MKTGMIALCAPCLIASAALAEESATSELAPGRISAKPNTKTEAVVFDGKTAVLANWFDRFTICLSDRKDDPVSTGGQFSADEDDKGPYHRIVITLNEVPGKPGDYEVQRFVYQVKDETLNFNFGWSGDSLKGTVTLTAVEGKLPEAEGVKARPARIEGKFEVTNTYGGVFKGSFKAEGVGKS